jgi:hypothetical protein
MPNGVQDLDESGIDEFTVDVMVEGIGDPGAIAYVAELGFPQDVLGLVSADSRFVLAANSGSQLTEISPVPTAKGAVINEADFGDGIPETGGGVLTRLVFQLDSAAPDGLFRIWLVRLQRVVPTSGSVRQEIILIVTTTMTD